MAGDGTLIGRHTPIGDVVAAAGAGDSAAGREIVRRYSGLVSHVARSYRLNAADTADVVQNTWARLFASISSLRQPERLGAWLATTTRREVLRVIRRARRDVPKIGREDDEIDLTAPEPVRCIGSLRRRADLRAVAA